MAVTVSGAAGIVGGAVGSFTVDIGPGFWRPREGRPREEQSVTFYARDPGVWEVLGFVVEPVSDPGSGVAWAVDSR